MSLRLQVIEALFALVAHGGEFIDRARRRSWPTMREVANDRGVAVEAHFSLAQHAHDADDGFIDLVFEHDLVVGSGLGVLGTWANGREAGGRVLALQHLHLGAGQVAAKLLRFAFPCCRRSTI